MPFSIISQRWRPSIKKPSSAPFGKRKAKWKSGNAEGEKGSKEITRQLYIHPDTSRRRKKRIAKCHQRQMKKAAWKGTPEEKTKIKAKKKQALALNVAEDSNKKKCSQCGRKWNHSINVFKEECHLASFRNAGVLRSKSLRQPRSEKEKLNEKVETRRGKKAARK